MFQLRKPKKIHEMKIAVEFLSERDWGIYSNYN